jgi:hypothetical protein
MVGDEQDSAVVRVGDGETPVGVGVGVIGVVEVGRPTAEDPGNAEQDAQAVRPDVDRHHIPVILLVGDQSPAPRLDERVVVEVQDAPGRDVRSGRIAPHDRPLGVDDEDPVVAAIGDQEVAGKARPDRRRLIGGDRAGVRVECLSEPARLQRGEGTALGHSRAHAAHLHLADHRCQRQDRGAHRATGPLAAGDDDSPAAERHGRVRQRLR